MTGTQAPELPTTAGPAVTDPALVPLPIGRPRAPEQVRGKLFTALVYPAALAITAVAVVIALELNTGASLSALTVIA